MKDLKKVVQGHETEIEAIRKEMEVQNQGKTDVKEQADAVTVKIDTIEEELTAIFAAKDEKREVYWKARYNHKVQRDHIAHIEWMHRQKDRATQKDVDRAEIMADREQALKELPRPYEQEL